MLTAAAGLTIALAPAANASPEDPHGDDYVAIAISPSTLVGAYGSDGTAEGADNIALSECAQSGAGDCIIAQATRYGCVAYVFKTDTHQWAGGRGPDADAAVADAQARLPIADGQPGAHCSS